MEMLDRITILSNLSLTTMFSLVSNITLTNISESGLSELLQRCCDIGKVLHHSVHDSCLDLTLELL